MIRAWENLSESSPWQHEHQNTITLHGDNIVSNNYYIKEEKYICGRIPIGILCKSEEWHSVNSLRTEQLCLAITKPKY